MEPNQSQGSGSVAVCEIAGTTPYEVIDTMTGAVVYRTTYANRLRARQWADRKDQEWGAYRYAARIPREGQSVKEGL